MVVVSGRPDRGRAGFGWLAIVAFLALSVMTLSPDGLSGRWIWYLLGGGVLAAIAATVRGQLSRNLWTVAGFVMGGTVMVVVFRHPFDWRHWCGVLLLIALLVLQLWQTNGPADGRDSGL